MRVRYQADADLDGRILRGLRRIAVEIDFALLLMLAWKGSMIQRYCAPPQKREEFS